MFVPDAESNFNQKNIKVKSEFIEPNHPKEIY